jgi:HAD superfamily phosphatase (TIGR01668 family)
MFKGVIFDFNRTIYDPEKGSLTEGVCQLLEDLYLRKKLCLISVGGREREQQIQDLEIEKYFVSTQVVHRKTQSHFRKCMQYMLLSAEEVVVVGDRVRSEIYIGNRLGMKTIWYESGIFRKELPRNKLEQPDYRITQLEEILRHF